MINSSSLSKRAAYSSHPIVVVIKFYILYSGTCQYQCQINASPTLNSLLINMSLTPFVFDNVQLFMSGVFYKVAPRIKFVKVVFVSQIGKIIRSI